ncbi:MAG: hypothetical protein EPO11_11050 [Gammaproteobacteria bacterium]|nr:MAG: hypothetical protein EPO11_11050 [Gammaproteobacteria bacterium]
MTIFNLFKKKPLLGEGSFAKVYKSTYQGREVAVKQMKFKPHFSKKEQFAKFEKEAAIMQKLTTSGASQIVSYYDSKRKYHKFTITMEYMPNGSLSNYIRSTEKYSLDPEKQQQIALDITKGLQHLHSLGFIHRDFKSDNVLLDRDFRAKITDFGLTEHRDDIDPIHGAIGTPLYLAPELLLRLVSREPVEKEGYSDKTDIYALGIIFYELFTWSDNPYLVLFNNENKTGKENLEDMIKFVLVKKKRPLIPEDSCTQEERQLITQSWAQKPANRPTADELVEKMTRRSLK